MDSETRQRLLELVYDLLPEGEAAELRDKIHTDSDLAAAYREAQETARLLAEAARLPSDGVQVVSFEKAAEVEKKPSLLPPGHGVPQPMVKSGPIAGPSFARTANWTVGLAAAALVLISVGGWFYHREQLAAIAAEHLRLVVTGPSTIQAGVNTEYMVGATAIDGRPVPAKVEVSLLTDDGTRLKAFKETADERGRLLVTIPADLKLPPQTQFHVVAWHGDTSAEAKATLAVKPERYDAQLALDRPLYQPGDAVRYRSLVLSRFALTADRDVPVHFEIHDPAGAVVAGSPFDAVTRCGVAGGEFAVSRDLPGGQYTLSARAADGSFAEQKRSFFVRHYRVPRLKKELEFLRDSYGPGQTVAADFRAQRAEGGAAAGAKLRIVATVDGNNVFEKKAQTSDAGALHVEFKLPDKIERGDGQLAVIVDDGGSLETQAKTIPINLGKLDVTFYPEGGDLAAGLENRVYFVARNPQGKPVDLSGAIVADGGGDRGRGEELVAVRTAYEGMGSFRFTPTAGAAYHLKIAQPAGVVNRPKLPAVSTERAVVLDAGAGVFAADKPLELSVRAAKAGLPLVVAAYCRGVQVGQQPLATKVTDAENPVEIALDGAVGGVIRLTVYDYSVTPPKPVAERLVYRRPAQKLNVKTATPLKRYMPGEKVDVALQVSDEKGMPAAAVLGVAVVNDALLNLADDRTASMPTHFLLTSEIDKPEDLENADFFLSDGRKGETSAAEALDLLLGTQGWRRFTEKSLWAAAAVKWDRPVAGDKLARLADVAAGQPPLMCDNIEQISDKYKQCVAAFQADRTPARNTLTAVSFFGGLGLVLLVAFLGLMRIVSGMHLWIPAVGATVCCLIVGAILMNPDRFTPGQNNSVAFAPYQAPLPKILESAAYGRGLVETNGPWINLYGLDGEWNRDLGLKYFSRQKGDPLYFYDAAGRNCWSVDDGAEQRWVFIQNGGVLNLGDITPNAGRFGFVGEGERLFEGLANRPMERYDREGRGRPVTAREYAHLRLTKQAGVRSDFTETLYWNPMLIADADGRATVRFDLSDEVTAFRLTADAHGNGRIGSGRAEVVSRIPFNLEIKLPLEVNAGDRIDLPVAVVNDTKTALPIELKLGYGKLVTLGRSPSSARTEIDLPLESSQHNLGVAAPTSVRKFTLAAQQRGREYFVLDVTGEKGQCDLKVEGTTCGAGVPPAEKSSAAVPAANATSLARAAETAASKYAPIKALVTAAPQTPLRDQVTRPLRVVPPGFPKVSSYSGQLSGPQELVVKLPEQWVPGSLEVSLNVFPSSLASLKKGLDGTLQEPTGCFEQASMSNYPNVMTMRYIEQHAAPDPEVVGRTKDLLRKGYARLTGYECKQHGYEWFGGDPGHEALTAYGLMQFRDMQKVFDVDPAMIGRTAEWLLARRDGKGGFQRNSKALDSFGQAPADVTDAYITWALSESGQSGIDAEVAHSIELGRKSDDPYVLALTASTAVNANKKDDARALLDKLAKRQADDGHLDSRQGSVTRSGGKSLQVETTALAALAWLKSPEFAAQANKAVQWIVGQRQGGGGFGSTQATILALKVLVAHAEVNRQTPNAGKLTVERDGRTISQYSFSAGVRETIAIDGLEGSFKAGDNRLTINLTGDNRMPYVLNVGYRTLRPESSDACPVRLVTKLTAAKLKAGETVALTAELTNTTDQGQPMTVAIVGLPAGLEVRADQLEELKRSGVMDYYETNPREIIFYWRSLAPKRQATIKLDLQAAVPGRYTGPASRAYLYYTPENKQWCNPLAVEISR